MQGTDWQAWLVLGLGMISACASSDRVASVRTLDAKNAGAAGGGAPPATGAASTAITGGTSPSITATPTRSGMSGGGGSAGLGSPPMASGTAGGGFKQHANLDPNAKFDWPETAPGQAKCLPGTYVGMFGCSLFVDPSMPPPDGTPPDFSGPITLEFKKSADGEFLELANAKLDGSANDTLGFMGDLHGKLDCSTLELTATVSNGVYGLGSPILVPAGDVNGTVVGKLDVQAGQLTGTWSLFSSDGGKDLSCDGPWQAVLTP